MARVQIIRETAYENANPEEWTLWFQWCRYMYDNGTMQHGYRFIWRKPQTQGGALQAARGQARLPSIDIMEKLINQARKEGWGSYDADEIDNREQALLNKDTK